MDKRAVGSDASRAAGWLATGGNMGRRVIGKDWARTPLGAIGRWPPHLQAAAGICLESAFPAAIGWGADFLLLYNDAYAALLGSRHPAALGRPAREAWPEMQHRLEPWLREVAERGEAMLHRDERLLGGDRHFDLALSPVRGPAGAVDGVFQTLVETSDRVLAVRRRVELAASLAAEAERLHYLTAAAGIGCWDWNVVTDIGDCDARCRAIFALPPERPLSYACFLNTVHPGDRSRTDAAVQRTLANGGDYDIEFRAVAPDGSEHWVQMRGRVDFGDDGRPLRMAGIVIDISARKAAEAALAAHRARLEDEVAARTAQLLAANRELQTFAYGVAHDLKSPLRSLVSYSQLLAMEYGERLAGGGAEFLGQIEKSVLRMRALIDDLLAYSQVEQGGNSLRPIDLTAAVRQVLAEREDDFRRSGAELRLGLPPVQVMADPEGLAQVLRNLVDNALKYSAQAAPPVIEIRGEAADSRCRLWVRDNGLGFDMAQHDRIFELFQRLHRADDIPGTGIGLALVKKAMQRIGGRVWAESSPGRGATFFIELPVQEAESLG